MWNVEEVKPTSTGYCMSVIIVNSSDFSKKMRVTLPWKNNLDESLDDTKSRFFNKLNDLLNEVVPGLELNTEILNEEYLETLRQDIPNRSTAQSAAR